MTRVLLVEDDRDQLSVRALVLESAGLQVAQAHNAASALAALDDFQPDIVVMDLRFPNEGDGARLIRKIRARQSGLRIIVLSGRTADLTGKPEASMVDGILRKPARSERLLNTIHKLQA